MKQTISIFIAFLAVFPLVLTSCDKAEAVAPEVPATEEEVVIPDSDDNVTDLEAVVPPFVPGNKVRSSMELDGNNLEFVWTDGDYLGFWPIAGQLHFNEPQQALFYVTVPDASGNASFRANGWGLLRGRTYYSYYPYDNTATSSRVRVNYTWQQQTANGGTSHLGGYDYMHASVTVPNSGATRLQYAHLNSVAHFSLTIPSAYRSWAFTDMVLSASSNVLVSAAQYNPSTASPSLTTPETTSTFSVSLGEIGGITCDGNGILDVWCMMYPNSLWTNRAITVALYSDDGQLAGTFTPSGNQQAGRTYTYSATMSFAGAGRIDLSRQESANCYIVSASGDYKFKAVKGNTQESVTPVSVKVVWETVNTASAPAVGTLISTTSYENGYVHFSTPATFTEGNALIAAYSGANGTGDILWSWHIWCTDAPQNQEYANDAGALLDRNLGALSTSGNLSTGLHYQWGRKDPFPGPSGANTATPMAFAGQGKNIVASGASTGTIAYSVSHPASYIAGDLTAANRGDWLWSNPRIGVDWSLASADDDKTLWYNKNEEKTKYDPCPPGYRVPDGASSLSSKGFWGRAANMTPQNDAQTGRNLASPYSWAVGTGLYFPLKNSGSAFYPTVGWTNEDGSLSNDGHHVTVWTNFPSGVGNAADWNIQYSGYLLIYLSSNNAGTIKVDYNSGRSAGRVVRCMRAKTVIEAASRTANEGFGNTPSASPW